VRRRYRPGPAVPRDLRPLSVLLRCDVAAVHRYAIGIFSIITTDGAVVRLGTTDEIKTPAVLNHALRTSGVGSGTINRPNSGRIARCLADIHEKEMVIR